MGWRWRGLPGHRCSRVGSCQWQPHVLSAEVQLEAVRRTVSPADRTRWTRRLDVEPGHDHTDARRRHLQPGHLLRGPELKPQPARLHLRSGRSHDGPGARRLRRRQHGQQATRRQPDGRTHRPGTLSPRVGGPAVAGHSKLGSAVIGRGRPRAPVTPIDPESRMPIASARLIERAAGSRGGWR
jgi:hypothetical protein